MNSEFRDKKFGFKRFLRSFKHPLQGLKYAYIHEQSMIIHLIITVIAVALGFIFDITNFEWIITVSLLLTAGSLELLNTAIEATVDMITLEYHPLAKIAKDVASAAVFLIALACFVTGLIMYVPRIITLF